MQAHPLSEISLIRKLKLNQLMIFERVLETGSVVRAANEMRLTQPAVTKVIHELESCFDGALFARSNRGVVPTDLGLMLGRLGAALARGHRHAESAHAKRAGDGTRGHDGASFSGARYRRP